ncbi:MAG: DUF192 domain-containing protein [Candidatus Omnitrophota bacterium]
MQTVQIINATKNTIIAQEGHLALSFEQRLRGLLGRTSLGTSEAMILNPCSSIHTLFMHFAIDVVFVDKNMQIVKIFEQLSPNRLTPIIWNAKLAIELPAGKINQTNTQIQDKIELK